jgi:hypothetical protein
MRIEGDIQRGVKSRLLLKLAPLRQIQPIGSRAWSGRDLILARLHHAATIATAAEKARETAGCHDEG